MFEEAVHGFFLLPDFKTIHLQQLLVRDSLLVRREHVSLNGLLVAQAVVQLLERGAGERGTLDAAVGELGSLEPPLQVLRLAIQLPKVVSDLFLTRSLDFV